MLDSTTPANERFAAAVSFHAPAVEEPILLRGPGGLPAKEVAYDRDEEIYGESEPADYIYCVRRGAVRTFNPCRATCSG